MCDLQESKIVLDPNVQNSTTFTINEIERSLGGGESCYYDVTPYGFNTDGRYEYQIDVKVTEAAGMFITVLSGSSFETAEGTTTINANNPETWNLKRSATVDDDIMNRLFIMVTADPTYNEKSILTMILSLLAFDRADPYSPIITDPDS